MALLHVSLVEPLHQVAMGWIPTLKYMLPNTPELLLPRPIVPGTKR
jgi:hypothetical protein